MDKEKLPVCPLLTLGSPSWESCIGERCAFWNAEAGECAITLLSNVGMAVWFTRRGGYEGYYIKAEG